MFRKIFKWLGIVLIIVGLGLIILMFTGNEKAEYVVNSTKDKVEYEFHKGVANIKGLTSGKETNGVDINSSSGYIPDIYWGGVGHYYELDTAGWREFVELTAYRDVPNNPPILGAHSNFGGSFIVPWVEGQRFRMNGGPYDGEWVVVDTLDVDKFGKVDQALGLTGDIGLQTCHWGIPVVRLVGAVPVDEYEAGYRGKSGSDISSEGSSDITTDIKDIPS